MCRGIRNVSTGLFIYNYAYYLKYKNKRTDFVDALFNIINWDNAAQRLDRALKLMK
jgi:Fe-Mn family superoxide dismutase